jgi:cytochrome P450
VNVATSLKSGAGIGLVNLMAKVGKVFHDPFGELEHAADLNVFAAQMRREPIVHSRMFNRFLFTARYDTTQAILRSPHARSAISEPDGFLQDLILGAMRSDTEVSPLLDSLVAKDGTEHSRLRKLIQPAFTHRATSAWRQTTERIATELMDQFDDGQPIDLVTQWAAPLPMAVICEILGVPFEHREMFNRWGEAMAVGLDRPRSVAEATNMRDASAAAANYLTALIAERRRHPGEDVVSTLANSEVDGEHLSDDDIVATASFLLIAGFETTVNLLGVGSLLLLQHPEQLQVALSDPAAHATNLVEEALRVVSPVQFTFRRVVDDIELPDGSACPANTEIVVMLNGANRDPAVFTDPERFDITRPDARKHLAFGYGAHMCIGAALARLEAEVAWRMLFERYPDADQWRLAGTPVPNRSRILNGLDSLPVALGSHTSPR